MATISTASTTQPKKKNILGLSIILLLVCLFVVPFVLTCIFLLFYVFLLRPFHVSGNAMYPSYQSGEQFITNLVQYRISPPAREDVIVHRSPIDQNKDFIKRVIGIPGDSIKLQNGKVFLNNNQLDESSYLAPSVGTYGGEFLADGETIEVPPNEYFVLGDNRTESTDSRSYGYVPKEDIVGKTAFCYSNCK